MSHLWEFSCTSFICSESFYQNIDKFSFALYIIGIITCRKQVRRTFDTFSQSILTFIEKFALNHQRWMWSHYSTETLVFGSHLVCKPHTPTKTNTKVLFYSLTLHIFNCAQKSLLKNLERLIFNVWHNSREVLGWKRRR